MLLRMERVAYVLNQVNALRAAIHQGDVVGEFVVLMQGLDGAHTKSLVGPQKIADPQNQNTGRLRYS